MDPRRVLYINRVGFLGGVERVAVTLAGGIGRHGYAPLLACPGEGELADAARARGIEVEPWAFDRMRITANPLVLARYPLSWWNAARQVSQLAEQHHVSLVHVHHPVGALYALPAVRRLGIPLVLHVHDGLPARPLYLMALRHAARHAARLICVSSVARELVEAAGIAPSRTRIIHNGVDCSFLGPPPDPTTEVAGPGPHVGVFGVLEPRKGQHVFLEAAALLAKRYPTARFWVVGPLALADKAAYQQRLEAMAGHPDLAGRVTFTGFRSDVARWMRAMDVVTLTSVEHESLGMVLVEAMALGRPVVASSLAGPMEVVRDGETGRLVPPGDAGTLAAAVTQILDGDRAAFAERAAADARARFSPEVFCRQVADVYDEVLAAQKVVA